MRGGHTRRQAQASQVVSDIRHVDLSSNGFNRSSGSGNTIVLDCPLLDMLASVCR